MPKSAHLLRRFLAIILSAALVLQPLMYARADVGNLPDLGDESGAIISPQQERQLGEDFMRKARHLLNILDDPELNEYLQNLGNRLLAHSDGSQQKFRFFLVDDPTLNAFAVPGGFIAVHTGLILAADNESELAGVLAHEIAHIQQHHFARQVAESKRVTGPALAALIAAILLGARSGGQAGEAAIAMTTAGLTQNELTYSRGFEQEADNIGIRTLAAAGFDPRGMPAFFERLQNWARLNESNLPEFLRDHPVTATRITESRNRAERYPIPKPADETAFHQFKAKIQATTGDPSEDVKTLQSLVGDGQRYGDAERYGYVWALLRDNQTNMARQEADELVRRHPDSPYYRIAQAETEMAARNYKQALKLYAEGRKRFPSSMPLAYHYASALLDTGQPAQARELLRDMVRAQRDNPTLYKMLGRAAGDTGAFIEAHQALAEYYYLNGNPDAALEQLHIASRFAKGNFYALSSIEARAKEIKEQAIAWSKSER